MDTLTKGQRRRHRQVPDDKRQRAAQACAQCKARKSRCVFVGSVGCQRCSRNALACEYLESPNPRTPASEARGPAAPSSIATAVPRRATGEAAPSAIATDAYQAERFMWPGFLAKLRESFSLDPIPDTQESVLQQAPMQAPVEPEVRAAEIRRLEQSAHAFPPRGVAHHLIKVLIQHGTDSFFYFDQARMIRGLEEFYSDRKSSLRYDTGFVCLALASLALGSQWTSLQCNDPSSMLPEYDVDEIGRTCYRHARLLVPDLDDSFSLEAVQAPFVLGVYLLPARATGSLHMYLGLALRKAMAMDLHTKAEAASLDDQEREIRSRLWWSVFSLERTMTVKLNRPRSVDPRIVTVSLPQSLPLLDKVQLFDNSLHQIANAQLTLILDRLSDSSSWSDNSVAAIEARASLKAWKQNLPSALKLENTSLASSDYRTVFHLHLNYHFAWITMGKFKVVSNVRSRLRESSGHLLAGFESTSTQLSKSCIKAAKKMLDLFGCIDQSGHMTKSSFTDFQGCSIATMILLVAGILERDLCYETRISFGLDCLRRMAGDHAAAISGVHFMEALKAIANEAAEKLQRSQALTHSEFLHMSPLSATPQQPDAQLLHLPPVEANTSAFWDRNRPLTEDSIFSASHNTWLEQNGSAWSPNYHSSGDPFALLQFDNEAFLTQLTELEVLGISGS